ncbi:hypothetical protein LMG32289_02621 [Cupriavidus pampae]|uniref:Uncharacterized protein n=1 Tax=Cupriavidus pampae TaxID=659251 RepID=A0ABN7YIE7_9BURK|nr:hypothetical protein LMG32289_02621 [Cupriavidus pampae]
MRPPTFLEPVDRTYFFENSDNNFYYEAQYYYQMVTPACCVEFCTLAGCVCAVGGCD